MIIDHEDHEDLARPLLMSFFFIQTFHKFLLFIFLKTNLSSSTIVYVR